MTVNSLNVVECLRQIQSAKDTAEGLARLRFRRLNTSKKKSL